MKQRRLPLGIKDHTKTELPALVALEAIGQHWFSEAHRADLRAIGLVAQLLARRGSRIQVAADALIAFLESDNLNIEELRPIVVEINRWLQVQSNSRIQAAIESLLRRQAAVAGRC